MMIDRMKFYTVAIISTAINGVAELPCRIAPVLS